MKSTFYFVDSLPKNAKGFYVDYDLGSFLSTTLEEIPIKGICHSRSEEFRQQLWKWFNFMREGQAELMPFWKYSTSSRITAWYPEIFRELFFAVALKSYVRTHSLSESVYVLNSTRIIKVILEGSIESRSMYLQAIKEFLLTLYRFGNLFKRSIYNTFTPLHVNLEGKHTIFTIIIKPFQFSFGKDHFFGEMLSELPNSHWVFFRDNLKTDERKYIEDKIEGKGILLNRVLNVFDIFPILIAFLKFTLFKLLRKNKCRPFIFDGEDESGFSQIYLKQEMNFDFPLNELEIHYSFKKIGKNIASIIFPYEEKGIERAILDALSPDTPSFGYAHAVHNYGHLYLRKDQRGSWSQPQYLLASGEGAKEWIASNFNYNAKNILVLGSHRNHERKASPSLGPYDRPRFLVLGSQGYEMQRLSSYCKKNSGVFNQCDLVLRLYPYHWHQEQADGAQQVIESVENARVCNKSIEEQIEESDFVIFSSTSAGIEAILAGRVGIRLDMDHVYPLNLLQGRRGAEVIPEIKTSEELQNLIKEYRAMSSKEYNDLLMAQQNFCQKIYSSASIESLLEVLNE